MHLLENTAENCPGLDEETRLLQEIIQQNKEADYHRRITECKSWTAMYQLSQLRGNVIEWLDIPRGAKVLELGAGCGAITSVLLKKGAALTCQEENIHYSRLNAIRHKDRELDIYAMPFAQCEPRLDCDYDMIFLIGILHGTQDLELLRQLDQHLKQDGSLIIAIENKFGLKYWAGNKEPHTREYFAGLENTAEKNGIRLYTKTGLAELLVAAGFTQTAFYYPYPDYRFALDIYSERYLPKQGDLAYNIANYEDDRLVLFDEQKVFDSIIEEGLFPLFSNSYLCIAQKGTETAAIKPQILYARYAADRARKYAVRTDVPAAEDAHAMPDKVRKYPLYPQGAAHAARMAEAYTRLSGQYRHTGLKFNHCELIKEADGSVYAEFEYLHAKALQAQLRQLIASGSIKKVFDILHRMMQYIRNGKKNMPFEITKDFVRVFGKILPDVLPEGTLCSEVSDIDLILPNILVDEQGAWNVIDYEWTFFFPIPQNFIIYRTLFFLHQENAGQKELSMDALLAFAQITPKEAEAYAQMEAHFQRYVMGGLTPYREMVNLLGRRFWDIARLEKSYEQAMAQNELLKSRGFWKLAGTIKRILRKTNGD